MKSYLIGPSEMDAEMFTTVSYADAMRQARATFGRQPVECWGCFDA